MIWSKQLYQVKTIGFLSGVVESWRKDLVGWFVCFISCILLGLVILCP